MPIFGAHQSIAGGYYKAVEAAARCGCQCVQLFTKNNNQWRAKPIVDDDVARFRSALAEHKIAHPLSHNSYLINMAAADGPLWKQSVDAFVVELLRAEQLGIPYVVAHPGAYTSTSEAAGLAQIVRALDEVHRQTPALKVQTLLENTAGQGSSLGCRFEHLAAIIGGVGEPERLGVCIDTCHVFAAGYPLAPRKEYLATMREIDRLVGLDRIRAFHLNDSKKPLGSRVDRHAHIGHGAMGLEPFRLLVNDRRFGKIPMYLETPKEADGEFRGEELDRMNLATLRGLIRGEGRGARGE
ncbi:MAG TPA: deoxyribonuclease IV [Pirellulales bacterium]|jgi:deoxyribonuclease-4|nr:deoxyribonuclease IV [Pirellulales bacterium]